MIPLLALDCGDDPFWCSACSSCLVGWSEGAAGLPRAALPCPRSLLWVSSRWVFALFFSKPPPLPPLSLLFPSHRAITGVHASTASICQHDHVSEEGTLRRHGVRCGRTSRHHRSQWWRGGVLLKHTAALSRDLPLILCVCVCVCVCVWEPSHPFTPMNLSSSIWCFFLLY